MANLENNFFNVGKGNKKTGVMLTTRSPRNTCPDDCGLKSNGCYAENAPIVWWWDKQDKTEKDMLDAIRRVPKNHLWRHNEAGDFVSNGGLIDENHLAKIVTANRNKKGFTYTHHRLNNHNKKLIKEANESGFTINLSADTVTAADSYMALNIAPVCVLLPLDTRNVSYTPAGHKIVACPAEKSEKVTCASCGLCQLSKRAYLIGFRAHGTKKKQANKIALTII
ncbi:hypothetical protein [uncultured Agitococcus sp.]|uniref:DUF7227 family protein n=1 Tax=uncultured Agitococcus sp. TaxID=1506599 RepID=UPI002605BEF6|nr:hypothetical protein [uncultured Agitococcus sp.]